MRLVTHSLAVTLAVLLSGPAAAQQPNIVLILADDVGTDFVGAYGEGSLVPCTPNIDALAAEGMLFRNTWTNPLCSATRGSLLTGRYAFRHGIGVTLLNTEPGLALAEDTLPEVLLGYESRAVGKWHLNGDLGLTHPGDSGFDDYRGSIGGGVLDYFNWTKTTNGVQTVSTTYVLSDTIDDAVDAMANMQEPWFLYVSLNSIHTPYHVPPSSLCSATGCGTAYCQSVGPETGTFGKSRAMMEALDFEVGRLLVELEAQDPNALVVFMGDNGTRGRNSVAPFAVAHGKGTVYEGGIGVPLIIKGPGVLQGQCKGLVSSTDLFATFTELAGVSASAEDSVSLVPYFLNPALPSLRTTVYNERFLPNHAWPKATHQQAIRGSRYKLIRRLGQPDEYYDLRNDAFETQNLLPELSSGELAAFLQLEAELATLTVPIPVTYCTAGTSANGCQALISSFGTASASIDMGFELRVAQVEGSTPGLFFFGTNGRQANSWGSGTSFQCVTPSVVRTPIQSSSGSPNACDGAVSIDLSALWCSTCPQPSKNPGAGATVQAQLWYRDALNTSNQTTSLSDAIEFGLEP